MKSTGALTLVFLAVALAAVPAESPTAIAQDHVRKACEAVWANAAPYQIQRCTDRAMAALGRDEMLRYTDLERLLQDSESDLKTCKAELRELQSEISGTKVTRKKPHSPTPR